MLRRHRPGTGLSDPYWHVPGCQRMLRGAPSPEDNLDDWLGALASWGHPAAVCPWISRWNSGLAVSDGLAGQLSWPCLAQRVDKIPLPAPPDLCSCSHPPQGGYPAPSGPRTLPERSPTALTQPQPQPQPVSSICKAPSLGKPRSLPFFLGRQ